MVADLIGLVQRLGQPRVLVVGDVGLDRYVFGDTQSPEVPMARRQCDGSEERLGGAGSVATMLRALGARVSLVGAVGGDPVAGRIRQLLTDLDIDSDGVLTDSEQLSSVMGRYIGRAVAAHRKPSIPLVYAVQAPVSETAKKRLAKVTTSHLRRADIVLVADYHAGVCTLELLAMIAAEARQHQRRVLVGPIQGEECSKYRGCSAMTLNRREAGLATGRNVTGQVQALEVAMQIREQLDLEAAVVTLDKDGLALAHRDCRRRILPGRPPQVHDVTGVREMVQSVLGLALAVGVDYDPAIRLANVAGGLELAKIGAATVSRDEILRELLQPQHTANQRSIDRVALEELASLREEYSMDQLLEKWQVA
jgi:D-beta-D-heptose 7-phosphate kinase/D-beta-D-heptose 1-phosphate adenosyltransferase